MITSIHPVKEGEMWTRPGFVGLGVDWQYPVICVAYIRLPWYARNGWRDYECLYDRPPGWYWRVFAWKVEDETGAHSLMTWWEP